jgi:Rhodopirellula transposase DDE domain
MARLKRSSSRRFQPSKKSPHWAGQPLTSPEADDNLIAETTTRTGLTIHPERDTGTCPRGVKATDRETNNLRRHRLTPHKSHGEWNHTTTAADTPT